jgi:hypothetical protein
MNMANRMNRRQFIQTAGVGAAAVGAAAYGISGTAMAQEPPVPCGEPLVLDLIAGQNILVGSVTVSNNENNLYVAYNITEEGWCLTETHVHVGTSPTHFPLNKKGNPQVGHFDFGNSHDCVTEYTETIPLGEVECDVTQLLIAAHAVVQRENPCPAIMYGTSLGSRAAGGERIYEIDVSTLTATEIFDTGFNSPTGNGPNGNAYDPVNNRLYFTEYKGSDQLWFIDLNEDPIINKFHAGSLSGGSVACGAWYNGKYYYIPQNTGTLYEVIFDSFGYVNSVSQKCLNFGGVGKIFSFGDIAIKDGLVYGSSAVKTSTTPWIGKFWTLNLNDCTYIEISDMVHMQLAFGSDGTLYGHDANALDRKFYRIDTDLGHPSEEGLINNIANIRFTDLASGPSIPCTYQTETAWGEGTRFIGKGNWAMYFGYTVQCCEEPCEPPPADMVAWWDADHSTDPNAVDIWGGNDGTMNGVTLVPGRVGQAFHFDGNSEIEIPDSPSLRPTMFTLDAWIKLDVGGRTELFISKPAGGTANSYALFAAGGRLAGYMSFYGSNSPVVQGPVLPVGSFFHAAMTWDGWYMRLYYNGTEVNSWDSKGGRTIKYTDNLLLLGAEDEGGGPPNYPYRMIGTLDEVEIFSRALLPGEIQAIYEAGADGKCKP